VWETHQRHGAGRLPRAQKHCEHCDGDGTLTHGARKPATDVPVRHTAAAGLDNRGEAIVPPSLAHVQYGGQP
jgi:hypothetical protein